MKIGTGEFLLIMVVALVMLGPEKMPLYAKKIGKALRGLKEYAGSLSEAIDNEILKPLEDVKKPIKKAAEPLVNIKDEITKPIDEVKKSVKDFDKPINNNFRTEKTPSEIETKVSVSEDVTETVS